MESGVRDARKPARSGSLWFAGSLAVAPGGIDEYRTLAAYVERDPTRGIPGIFAVYQRGFDSNPAGDGRPATSSATTIELYDTAFHDNAIFGIRKEFTNDGLGNVVQSGNLDFEYHISRFLHAYVETYAAQHQKPGYRYMLWWTVPLQR
jgi:hypothetical protein